MSRRARKYDRAGEGKREGAADLVIKKNYQSKDTQHTKR